MGRYLNPKSQSKEDWLVENASYLSADPPNTYKMEGHTLAMWVNNGAFTAVGLLYDQRELTAATDPNDPRPKAFFWIPDELAGEFR